MQKLHEEFRDKKGDILLFPRPVEIDRIPGTSEMRTILIVDDEERLRRGLARSLGREDRRTLTAASGEEALGLLKGRKVDLVITDLVMPGIDGMTLVRDIKRTVPGIEVIIITAYGSAESMKEAEELGVACYLAKPFDLSDLKSRVDACLSGGTRLSSPRTGAPDVESGASGRSLTRAPTSRAAVAQADGSCPGGHRALCSICLVGGKTLRAVVGLCRKALPCVRPRNVMPALGRAARAVSRLASQFTRRRAKREVKGK